MELIRYLREKGLESLISEFFIETKRHQNYPHLVQLKYSQLESPMSNKIVQQCRGIILDELNDWNIINYPFDKFFNHSESKAAEIDWKTAKVFEKLDGSLMSLYFYDSKWNVASSGLPDASGSIRDQEYTFEELFWKIWKKEGYDLPLEKTHCYVFEMTDPSTKILVPYEEGELRLIGARDLKSLKELHLDQLSVAWRKVQHFPLTDLQEILNHTHELNPIEQEGYVVCDIHFNRVKIKSPQYVKINLLKNAGKFTDRYLIEIIRINEGDEFLAYFEEHRLRYNELRERFNSLFKELELIYEDVKDIDDKKTIGLKVKETAFPSLFFQLKMNKVPSIKEYLKNVNIKTLESKLI